MHMNAVQTHVNTHTHIQWRILPNFCACVLKKKALKKKTLGDKTLKLQTHDIKKRKVDACERVYAPNSNKSLHCCTQLLISD